MVRLVVTGGRDFQDVPTIQRAFFEFSCTVAPITLLMEGDAPGLDRFAAWVARECGIEVQSFPADWWNVTAPGAVIGYRQGRPYNKLAGYWRNQQMLDEGKPEWGMVFPGGKGTADMAARMEKTLGIGRVWKVTK